MKNDENHYCMDLKVICDLKVMMWLQQQMHINSHYCRHLCHPWYPSTCLYFCPRVSSVKGSRNCQVCSIMSSWMATSKRILSAQKRHSGHSDYPVHSVIGPLCPHTKQSIFLRSSPAKDACIAITSSCGASTMFYQSTARSIVKCDLTCSAC